jgi:hypothetical protein
LADKSHESYITRGVLDVSTHTLDSANNLYSIPAHIAERGCRCERESAPCHQYQCSCARVWYSTKQRESNALGFKECKCHSWNEQMSSLSVVSCQCLRHFGVDWSYLLRVIRRNLRTRRKMYNHFDFCTRTSEKRTCATQIPDNLAKYPSSSFTDDRSKPQHSAQTRLVVCVSLWVFVWRGRHVWHFACLSFCPLSLSLSLSSSVVAPHSSLPRLYVYVLLVTYRNPSNDGRSFIMIFF